MKDPNEGPSAERQLALITLLFVIGCAGYGIYVKVAPGLPMTSWQYESEERRVALARRGRRVAINLRELDAALTRFLEHSWQIDDGAAQPFIDRIDGLEKDGDLAAATGAEDTVGDRLLQLRDWLKASFAPLLARARKGDASAREELRAAQQNIVLLAECAPFSPWDRAPAERDGNAAAACGRRMATVWLATAQR